MDTMTYASVAAIPMGVSDHNKLAIVPEVEFTRLDLSYVGHQ